MYELREAKKSVRNDCIKKRDLIPESEKKVMDEAICRSFLSLASYRYCNTVLAYYPIGSEINIIPLLENVLASGKKLALPCTLDDGCSMKFYYVSSLDDLIAGKYGISEPRRENEFCEETSGSVLMIVPGLAYDKNGYRLGYGKGYYDRFLSKHRFTLAGIVYDSLFLDSVPKGKYDISVDFIVTDKGVKIIGKN